MGVQAPAGMNVSEDNGFFSFSYFIILGMLERSIFLNVTTVGFTATGKCVCVCVCLNLCMYLCMHACMHLINIMERAKCITKHNSNKDKE